VAPREQFCARPITAAASGVTNGAQTGVGSVRGGVVAPGAADEGCKAAPTII